MTTESASEGRTILDTSVVISAGPDPLPGLLSISSITIAELQFGVLIARSPGVRAERLRRLSVLQHRFEALPVDDTVAASYGRLAAAVVDAGRQPRRRVMDLLIAATAHAHGARLCTRNPDDFRGLEDHVEILAM